MCQINNCSIDLLSPICKLLTVTSIQAVLPTLRKIDWLCTGYVVGSYRGRWILHTQELRCSQSDFFKFNKRCLPIGNLSAEVMIAEAIATKTWEPFRKI